MLVEEAGGAPVVLVLGGWLVVEVLIVMLVVLDLEVVLELEVELPPVPTLVAGMFASVHFGNCQYMILLESAWR